MEERAEPMSTALAPLSPALRGGRTARDSAMGCFTLRCACFSGLRPQRRRQRSGRKIPPAPRGTLPEEIPALRWQETAALSKLQHRRGADSFESEYVSTPMLRPEGTAIPKAATGESETG